jgi:hypothetical protein
LLFFFSFFEKHIRLNQYFVKTNNKRFLFPASQKFKFVFVIKKFSSSFLFWICCNTHFPVVSKTIIQFVKTSCFDMIPIPMKKNQVRPFVCRWKMLFFCYLNVTNKTDIISLA